MNRSHLQRNALNLAVTMALGSMGLMGLMGAPAALAAEVNAAVAEGAESSAPSAAGATGAGLSQLKGETVVVTASRMAQPLLDVNSSMAVVSAAETRTLGVDNVPEMLRSEPGVTLMSDGTPGVKRVALRGENPSRTLLMVDGQRIDDQKNKSGAPLLINPYFIDRIEVVKGPSSVLYGSDALGGIVNVITKQAADKPFEFEGGLNFNSAYESFTEYANISGTLDRFKYAVGAFNTNSGDMRLSDNERLDHTSYDATGFNGDFSYDVLDNLTVGYAAEFFDTNAETSTTIDDPTYGNFSGDIPKWQRQKHKLYLKAFDLNEYLAAVDASFYYQKNTKDFNSIPQRGLDVTVYNEQESLGGNLQLEWSLGERFYLITGYDGRQETLDSDGSVGIALGPVFNAQFDIKDSDYKQQSHAFYALLSTYLTDELTLNTGVRYNYIKTQAGSSHLGGHLSTGGPDIPIDTSFNYDDVSQVKTLGSVGLVYRPWDEGAFRLNWSQGFRVPNIQELYLLTSTGTLQFGNPDLEPEESDNFELGFRWEDPHGGLMADVALFYTISDNYIETARSGQFYTYRNIAEAKSYGVEAALSYLTKWNVEPYLNITAMERKYETQAGSSTNTGTPKFFGNSGVKYYGRYFDLDGFAQFATSTKNDNLDGWSYFGATEYGGYVTLNLRVSTSFGDKDQFTVYASAENILDKSYQTNEIIHEPGRFFTLGVSGKF